MVHWSSHAKTIVDLASKLNAFTVTTVSARQIEDQRGKWRQIQAQLDGWMSRADARWQELQATRAELKQIEKQWQLTRDAESTAELPEEVRRRIDAIIARADSLLNSTQQRIDQVARIVEQLSEAHQLSTSSLDRVGKLSEGATRRLITRNVPPLWQTPSTDWWGLHESAWTVSQTWVQDLLAFAADYWVRLLLHLLVFVGLTIATVIARRSSHDWPEEHELDRARFLVSRPYSVALVFAVLAGVFIYGTLPTIMRDFFLFMILIPMLRLAAGLTSRTERFGLYGLSSLMGLHLAVQLCPADSLLLRLMLLATDMAAATLVGYLMWRGRWRSGHQLTWRRSITLAGCAVVLSLFVVAFVANVLGWINLY